METVTIPLFLLLFIGGGIASAIVLSTRKRAQRPGYSPAGYGYLSTQCPPHQAPPQPQGYPPRYGQPSAQSG